jgi:hypothetical protein
MTRKFFSRRFTSPGSSGDAWTRTFDLGMMRQMFYRTATTSELEEKKVVLIDIRKISLEV